MSEPTKIPDDQLIKARLKLKRKVVAQMINAMAETGQSYADLEAKIGWKSGRVKQWINDMIDGTTNDLDPVSDTCMALNVEPQFSLRRLAAEPEAPETA